MVLRRGEEKKCFVKPETREVLSNQQTKARRRAAGAEPAEAFLPPRPPPHPSRVSPRCDVTERWRLSRFTVREKSPCSLLPPPPTLRYSSSLISAAPIPSLPCFRTFSASFSPSQLFVPRHRRPNRRRPDKLSQLLRSESRLS
jgi:hypothetical protein